MGCRKSRKPAFVLMPEGEVGIISASRLTEKTMIINHMILMDVADFPNDVVICMEAQDVDKQGIDEQENPNASRYVRHMKVSDPGHRSNRIFNHIHETLIKLSQIVPYCRGHPGDESQYPADNAIESLHYENDQIKGVVDVLPIHGANVSAECRKVSAQKGRGKIFSRMSRELCS